jgi:hypothetical protein
LNNHVTDPETTQTDPLINNIVTNPLVANVKLVLAVLVPATYVVTALHVIVTLPEVLLNKVTALPLANTPDGIVIDPLVPMPINLPVSAAVNV